MATVCYETRRETYFQFAFTNEHSSCTHNSIAACNCHSSVMVHVHAFVVQLVVPKVRMIAHIVIADDSQSQTSKIKKKIVFGKPYFSTPEYKRIIYTPMHYLDSAQFVQLFLRAHLEFYNYTIYCDVHTHIYHTQMHTRTHTHTHMPAGKPAT